MSGSEEIPHVVLIGEQTRRLVEAINAVADISGSTPTIVGGLAVLCRVRRAHRATADLDALDRHGAPRPSLLELLRTSPGAESVEPSAATVATPSGPVRVDVIDVIDAPDATDIPDPTDRLYEMSHAWALRTASPMRIDGVGAAGNLLASATARVAEPGPLLAMKLQAPMMRTTAKEGTDLLDIVTILLDQAARDAALAQLERCHPAIAADAALHADRWFVKQVDRSLRLIRSAGGSDIGRDELALVAELLLAATRRD